MCWAHWLCCISADCTESYWESLAGEKQTRPRYCAGNPLEETKTVQGTVLAYYKEASMFEESFATSKASRPGAHHGCWARLLMEEDRVVGVEYRSVQPSVDASDHCVEIFRTCVQ